MTNRKDTDIGSVPLNWEIKSIGEIGNVTKLAGFEYSKYFSYVDDGEIIALRALNVRDGFLDLNKIKRIYKKVSDNLERSKLYKGDILFTYVGANIGQFALVDENDKYHLAPNICRIRTKNNEYLSNFLYCYFRSYYFQENLVNYAVGSSQPTMPMGNIRKILVPVPSLLEQEFISDTILSLDRKIDLLQRQNQTLEALAETVFRQKFIEEENTWEEKPLDTIAEFLNGLACQKYPVKKGESGLPVIKIKELKAGISDASDIATNDVPTKYLINDGDMLFSWSGSLDVAIWFGGKGVLNQHLFKVSSTLYPQWFYYYWVKFYLPIFRGIANDKATTMGHIQRHHLTDVTVTIPDDKTLKELDKVFSPYIQKIKNNSQQIKTLTNLRDTLLPKLMNGEVTINN